MTIPTKTKLCYFSQRPTLCDF
uniref:Uncharacterized protein n=1 Tax=Anguilla anguilla TaxID=7936 RepID=A0A0E9UD52_ANGAN